VPFSGYGNLGRTMRTIRRYSNRKLYDTQESHYVTLTQIAAMIRAGDEIRVLHKDTGADITSSTLAMVILEEERRSRTLPIAGLEKIIRTGRIS
jgi:polyhydroxyalkanoate synthesis repressor PhaR